MAIDTASPRSRRALLAAGLGAGVATVASAIGRPLPANATDGDPMVVGGEYVSTSVTKIDAGSSGATALWGISTLGSGVLGQSTSGYGIYGTSNSGAGVVATANTGDGVYGSSGSGRGVNGESISGYGVRGTSDAAAMPAILGASGGANTGVQGYSGAPDSLPATPAKTGVFGYAAQDATAVGVKGESTTGTGGLFTTTTGTALQVAGKAKFSRSGRATVLKGKSYVDVTVTGGMTSHSMVHATLQTYRSGVSIAAVRINYPTAGKARIYLTKVASTTASTYVAWFVAEY